MTLTAVTPADGENEVSMAEKKAAGKRMLKTLKKKKGNDFSFGKA